ncbi:hypothetical protein GUITHDRAFT_137072 [Guillardia theta CCMP2712]|uniref:Methyltransferase domain-containing protein n=1 Tax=Guillardia theta (strain CCMP2712) TaxID=905079 RepID=L1JHY6_GUITC|nr:hypothetical protein GUITHDRAFT_137072 [Guillardia theta CCMP2712]EKX48138.1 hypothetical protein GUITHDRAFT_137072 [Guillardia theta CCMP2712]|eukprot:XP_005835118.1 hypothetical protein GUITHDRAFT_137072 [Guillardia theta CCMP2712]
MIVGCGSSKLSKILYDLGHRRITNVDIDEGIIEDMKRKYEEEAPEMSWVTCDITKAKESLEEDESFDLILDKGTLDALLCADGVTDGYMEILRLLRVGGVFSVISFRPAELIAQFLRVPELPVEVEIKTLETGSSTRKASMFLLRKISALPWVDRDEVRSYQNDVIKVS